MSPEAGPAEDLFLGWLIGLPEGCDLATAAVQQLAELRQRRPASPTQLRLCELLRQVTPFAQISPRRRQRRDRRHAA